VGTVFFITDFIFFSTPTIHVSNCLPVRVGYTKSVERDHQSGLRAYLPDSFLTSSSVLPWRLCAEANCQQLLVCDSTKCMEPSHKILPNLSNRTFILVWFDEVYGTKSQDFADFVKSNFHTRMIRRSVWNQVTRFCRLCQIELSYSYDSTKCMEPSHKILPSLSNRMVYPYQCKIKASCCSLTPRACSGSGESRAISLSTLIGKRTQIPDVARAVYDKGTGTSG
jgi:hypothetical protein